MCVCVCVCVCVCACVCVCLSYVHVNDKLHMKKVKCQVNIYPWSPGYAA